VLHDHLSWHSARAWLAAVQLRNAQQESTSDLPKTTPAFIVGAGRMRRVQRAAISKNPHFTQGSNRDNCNHRDSATGYTIGCPSRTSKFILAPPSENDNPAENSTSMSRVFTSRAGATFHVTCSSSSSSPGAMQHVSQTRRLAMKQRSISLTMQPYRRQVQS